MEDREIIKSIKVEGSLEDRKNIKQYFINADLNAIKEAEVKCFEHTTIVSMYKDLGLSYQWHENKANDYQKQMKNLTDAFLLKY